MEEIQGTPLPLADRRYVVGWELQPDAKTKVFVYDKWMCHIVYTVIAKERKKTYSYIQRYYGTENCVKPKEMDSRLFG